MKTTQQMDLYAAEGRASRGRMFASLDEIQAFVNELKDTHWWHAQGFWTIEHVEVGRPSRTNERGGSVGWYDRDKNAGRIEMAACHWCERDVLHELAHVLAGAKHDSEAHDPYFARVYLTLVSCVMGPTVYTELRDSFNSAGIVYETDVSTGRFAL